MLAVDLGGARLRAAVLDAAGTRRLGHRAHRRARIGTHRSHRRGRRATVIALSALGSAVVLAVAAILSASVEHARAYTGLGGGMEGAAAVMARLPQGATASAIARAMVRH